MKKMYLLGLLFCVTASLSKAQNCPAYEKAKEACEHFKDGYEKIRQLEVSEQKQLVRAMCEANDDERISVGKSAAERVQSDIWSNYDDLKKQKEEAEKYISMVLQDQQCNGKWDEAKRYQNEIDKIWPRIEKLRVKVTAGSNPVFDVMRQLGQEAHDAYQSSNSGQGLKEHPVASGKVDFITYGCQVIELKSNNSSSQSKGIKEAIDYTADLNKDNDFNSLVQKDSKFAPCKGVFKAVVMCYNSCPEITDDGEMHLRSIEWSKHWSQ
jgi:hypothetical protein